MNIILHIGTNKTGSSTIQTIVHQNKLALLKRGFFVPDSKWDKAMQAGEISPGNGHELAVLLISQNRKNLYGYLKSCISKAHSNNAKAIFFSNEVIVRLFSDLNIINLLKEAFNDLGIKKVTAICCWRAPIEHALSLYKHRAKSGCFTSYSNWFATDYETIRVSKSFLENKKKVDWFWVNLAYSKDTECFLSPFFFNAFGISLNELNITKKRVNESLTLNQIKAIEAVEPLYPQIAEVLHQLFTTTKLAKSDERILKLQFNRAALKYLLHHSEVANELSKLSGSNWPLKREEAFAEYSETEFNLSEEEFLLIIKGIEYYKSKRVYFWLRKNYRKVIGVFNSREKNLKKFDSVRFGGSLKL